jgi:beta-glucanase (GH16 family)
MKIRSLHRLLVLSIITGSFACTASVLAEPKLVWSDEFDVPGLPDKTKWSYDVGGGGWGNQELQYYTKADLDNARVDENGVLIIEARKETSPETPFGQTAGFTSARLVTKAKGDWQFGRFEIRAKLPYGNGTWPAIWMLPTMNAYGGWPRSGEIDIMEHVGSHMGDVLSTLHFANRSGDEGPTRSIEVRNVENTFHVYAAEWRPGEIKFFINDVYAAEWRPGEIKFFINDVCFHTQTDPQTDWQDWPFDQPFHLLLNIAVGGTLGGKKGVDPDIWPQRMEVDYVRVYDLGDSPKLDHDGDGLVDAEDPDDDNDGFSDAAEMDAGSNPHKSDETPATLLALLRADTSGDFRSAWFKRTQTYSAGGEPVGDAFAALTGEDLSLDDDGNFVFKGTSPESGRVETSIFQPTDVKNGLAPGDVITFSGKASTDAKEDGQAEVFIVVYTTEGGFHPTSVIAPIDAATGTFSLSTTLEKGPVQGVAVGFTIKAPAGTSPSITFSGLEAGVEGR